jgi:hypothetical protein
VKFCIYLKRTEPDVSFLSEEHIFPAAIGGIQKLPLNYVSHDCNNYFSSMELTFMRNSLIAISRQFHGPGKRGNLNPKNATKSNVSLMARVDDPNSISLGYISLGQPFNISQIKINKLGTCTFKADSSLGDGSKLLVDFMKSLEGFNGKYILHEDERISENEFILGYQDGKWYVALSNKEFENKLNSCVEALLLQKPLSNKIPEYSKSLTSVMQTLKFDDTYFRVCAKIIFNYLAFSKGQDFVLNSCFDPLRDWIVNGGENKFAVLIGKEFILPFPIPDLSHKFYIIQDGKSLRSIISFYGDSFATQVDLCENFEGSFEIDGFICDWKERKEYTWGEFILKLVYEHNLGIEKF